MNTLSEFQGIVQDLAHAAERVVELEAARGAQGDNPSWQPLMSQAIRDLARCNARCAEWQALVHRPPKSS